MAGHLPVDGQARRYGVLVDPGQGVEFGENRNDRATAAVTRNECRRYAGDACLQRKSLAVEGLLQQRRTLCLLVADLRILPDRARELRRVFVATVNKIEYRIVVLRIDRAERQQEKYGCDDEQCMHGGSPLFGYW